MNSTLKAMEIEEGNVLIARYMDELEYEPLKSFAIPQFERLLITDYYAPNYSDNFLYEELEYHKNWNWLMPVVQKICSESTNIDSLGQDAYLTFINLQEALIYGGSIEYVWSHVIGVIKYLNTETNEKAEITSVR